MRAQLSSIAALLFFLGAQVAQAQSESVFDDSTKSAFRAVTNAFIALVGDDSVAAGSYHFKDSDPEDPDSDLELYKILAEMPLGDKGAQFIPLLSISPSYLDFDQSLAESGGGGHAGVNGGGVVVGAGVEMNFFDRSLKVIPRFKVQYSSLDFDFDIPGADDAIVDALVPDIKTWTYIPSLEAGYRHQVRESGGAVLLDSTGSYVWMKAMPDNVNLDDFTDHSWIWRNRVGYELPWRDYLIRPGIGRVDIYGEARKGLGVNNFYEYGIELMTRKLKPELLEEAGVGLTYVHAQEIQGWRFSVLIKFT